jgi:hypothetical protein
MSAGNSRGSENDETKRENEKWLQQFKREREGMSKEELERELLEFVKSPWVQEILEASRARIYVTFRQVGGSRPEKGHQEPKVITFGPYVDISIDNYGSMWVKEQAGDGEPFILAISEDLGCWRLADGGEESDACFAVAFQTYRPKPQE